MRRAAADERSCEQVRAGNHRLAELAQYQRQHRECEHECEMEPRFRAARELAELAQLRPRQQLIHLRLGVRVVYSLQHGAGDGGIDY